MASQLQAPSEIVFSLASTTHDPCVFRYDHGPVKLNAPRRRGRPLGSTKKPKLKERSRGGDDDGPFQFIHMAGSNNSSSISAETRKAIRKRAAISNDYAQKRKLKIINKQQLDTPDIVVVQEINDVDPFNAFPVKLEPYMLDLLKYYMTTVWKSFYTIESHTSLNPMTDYWLPLAFYDNALLHLIIGCADTHAMRTGYRTLRGEQRPIWLKHLQKAVTIVKTRIETLQSVSDETIAIVATLAFIEKTRGSVDNWRIHMEGLKRLVDLRGGLDSLESKPMVMNKVFRADLAGSIDAIQLPFLSRQYLPFSSLHISTNNSPETNITSTTSFKALNGIDSRLTHCITSLAEATHLLASLLTQPKPTTTNDSHCYTEAANIRFLITQTQYTLLSIQPQPHSYHLHPAHELCRLVLLLYSESMLNESPPQLPMCDLLVETVREHLQNQSSNNNDGKDGDDGVLPAEFKLWALFVAASTISANNEVLMEWSLRAIAATAMVMRIDEWDRLVRVFGKFLWDEGVQGARYAEIWNDAQALAAEGCIE